ncbi:hypothetical protein [Lactobacillus helveticus]|jgi:uncharacterized membrane protein|uniref:Uncharacterized protein n=3 Tax=Lactobacillus helveticus TaxID=1587 RepID=U4QFW2_LACHE|nr:hypothetical protein [Lactobacillus helveticus]ALI52540.1 hypothetical protein ALV80_05255 [Lactobacillus helveticus]MBW7987829.1 hypothetical protein [Lactobacillus helveticus]NRN72032.1 hypothetical protein [Lactobacillus helveticus]NRN75189.1 hypothetical protein [Lactobacillus helveticus]NRN76417.1 hypothetical protein [Lactobacillus helveticus]
MKKNDKKRKLKYAISTVFFLIVTILDVFDLYNDIFNGRGHTIKDLIWLVILILATCGNYYLMKDVGTIDDDDERDAYVEMKTNSMMFNILNWIIIIASIVFSVWGVILYSRNGNETLAFTLIIIGAVLSAIWILTIIINFIVWAVNYHKN